MRLSFFDEAPVGLEFFAADKLGSVLGGFSFIRLSGRNSPPLFVSVLLHGNETTSWDVARELIKRSRNGALERTILLFVGNVAAAMGKKRYLAGQPDYNRIWSGGDRPENALASEALEFIRRAHPIAAIDIHNNTGRNPFYSCVSRLEPAHLHLAAMFSESAVYYTNPPSALSIACSAFAPSIAVECGKSGDERGYSRALELVESAMRATSFHSDFAHTPHLSLYHTLGRIVLDTNATYSFSGDQADIMFAPDIEAWNFKKIGAERVWARTSLEASPIRVIDEAGGDITETYFRIDEGAVRLIDSVIPAMLSTDRDNVRLDCLGYLMEPIQLIGAAQ